MTEIVTDDHQGNGLTTQAAELRRQADLAERVARVREDRAMALTAVDAMWVTLQEQGFRVYRLFELERDGWIVRRTYAGGEAYVGVTDPSGKYLEYMVNGDRLRRHSWWADRLVEVIVGAVEGRNTMHRMPDYPDPGLCEACGPNCEHCSADHGEDGTQPAIFSWSERARGWFCPADHPEHTRS